MLETNAIEYEVVKSDGEDTLLVLGTVGILNLITPNTPRHVILRGDVNDVVGYMYLPVPNGGNGTIIELFNTLPFNIYNRKYNFRGNGCGIMEGPAVIESEWLFNKQQAILIYNDGYWHISEYVNFRVNQVNKG